MCENCTTTPRKKSPPLSQQPSLKVEVLSSPPSWKFSWRFNPPVDGGGGGAHYDSLDYRLDYVIDSLGCWYVIFSCYNLSPLLHVHMNQSFATPLTPSRSSFSMRILWSAVSKVIFQSSKTSATYWLSSSWTWILFMVDMSTWFIKQFRWKSNFGL